MGGADNESFGDPLVPPRGLLRWPEELWVQAAARMARAGGFEGGRPEYVDAAFEEIERRGAGEPWRPVARPPRKLLVAYGYSKPSRTVLATFELVDGELRQTWREGEEQLREVLEGGIVRPDRPDGIVTPDRPVEFFDSLDLAFGNSSYSGVEPG